MASQKQQANKKVFLIGRPNVGKSSLFTALTGQYAEVANYCMTTTTVKSGDFHHEKICYELIDTPGASDLLSITPDILADLASHKPDVIVQCIDSTCLKQSLAMSNELIQLGLPMVVALTSLDRSSKNGVEIIESEMAAELGVQVIKTNPIKAQGIGMLKAAIQTAQAPSASGMTTPTSFTLMQEKLAAALPNSITAKDCFASLLLRGGSEFSQKVQPFFTPSEWHNIDKDIPKDSRPALLSLQKHSNLWIDDLVACCTRKKIVKRSKILERAAQLSRSPITGPFILLGVIYVMFLLVVHVANALAGFLDERAWVPVAELLASIIPVGFWQDILIGDYGVLSMGIANALLTVLPILSVFFLLYNTLEDIGYIANISVLTKRILGKIGLSGNSLMPMVLAFGCKTMATMTTKTLTTKKERYIAIFIIAFSTPCAAQLGLNLGILGLLGKKALFLVLGLFLISSIFVGLIINYAWRSSEKAPAFIMELPPIRIPDPRMIIRKTHHRILEFLEESFMIFVYAALFLFVLDRFGVLDACKNFLRPVIDGFLGLPLQMVDALILCLARQEAGTAVILNMVRDGALDYRQSIVAVVLVTMFIPCSAHIASMVKAIGSKDSTLMVCTKMLIAINIAGALNWFLHL